MIEIKDHNFYLDDKKINIYSGAIHYFRIMPQYWEDALTKLKLCGFNTVETYVCWNLHEKKQGEYDFSGMLDIVKFIETAQKVGLYAIVRPGPYICAEWDFGGLPSWLLKDKNMQIRCMYKPFTDAVSAFYKELLSRLLPLQLSNGGNIIAMQVENEYGSYGNDKEYLKFIKQLMLDCGVKEMLFTSDGAEHNMLSGGSLTDTFSVANFGSRTKEAFSILSDYEKDGPMMCGEFWNGWFDRWDKKEKHHFRKTSEVIPELKVMLSMNASFNFYMFYGGTNFGFNSGANYYNEFQPTVTSYDDDALINEWGGYTDKYHAVRKVLLEHQNLPFEELPPEPQLQNIGKVKFDKFCSLTDNLENIGTKIKSVTVESMEYFSQHSGFILYRHKLNGNYSGKLYIDGLCDRAHIYINKELKGILYRNNKDHFIEIGNLKGENEIEVLIEDMGRINYGPDMIERKGAERIRIENQTLFDWDVFLLPLDNLENLQYSDKYNQFPVFLNTTFNAQKDKSCFIHLDGFTKGYVFVNGFNLGRYWKVGPQKSLYIPGCLLNETNELTVLELDEFKKPEVTITDFHDIGQKKL